MRTMLTAVLLLTCGAGTAHAAAPDLSACPPPKSLDSSERQRIRPLAVPRTVSAIVKSDMDHYAVATLAGGTFCVDTSMIEDTQEDHALSTDKRFLTFTWQGYETGGYLLIDRSGKGQMVETGAEPSFSPSGQRLAAIEWSESGFGALNALGVWQLEPEGVKTLAMIEDVPSMTAWKIDRWAGEDCVEVSGVADDQMPSDPREIDFAPRTRFVAAQLASRSGPPAWKLLLGVESCPRR